MPDSTTTVGETAMVIEPGTAQRLTALAAAASGPPAYVLTQFLAFPAERPPSIECSEDAGEEDTVD